MRQECRQVAGKEHFALAVADDDAAGIPDARCHYRVRLTGRHDKQRVGAIDLSDGALHGLDQRMPLC